MQIHTVLGRLTLVLLSGLLFTLGCGEDSSDSSSNTGAGDLLLADDSAGTLPGTAANDMNQGTIPVPGDMNQNGGDGAGDDSMATPMVPADSGSDVGDGSSPSDPDMQDGSEMMAPDDRDGIGGVAANPLPNDCSKTGFQSARELARQVQDGYSYVALSSEMSPYDALQIATLGSFNGPMVPGVYSLDGINYADCGLCLLIEMGCSNPQQPCSKTFYADAGDRGNHRAERGPVRG